MEERLPENGRPPGGHSQRKLTDSKPGRVCSLLHTQTYSLTNTLFTLSRKFTYKNFASFVGDNRKKMISSTRFRALVI